VSRQISLDSLPVTRRNLSRHRRGRSCRDGYARTGTRAGQAPTAFTTSRIIALLGSRWVVGCRRRQVPRPRAPPSSARSTLALHLAAARPWRPHKPSADLRPAMTQLPEPTSPNRPGGRRGRCAARAPRRDQHRGPSASRRGGYGRSPTVRRGHGNTSQPGVATSLRRHRNWANAVTVLVAVVHRDRRDLPEARLAGLEHRHNVPVGLAVADTVTATSAAVDSPSHRPDLAGTASSCYSAGRRRFSDTMAKEATGHKARREVQRRCFSGPVGGSGRSGPSQTTNSRMGSKYASGWRSRRQEASQPLRGEFNYRR
jgi:hypothetical protein